MLISFHPFINKEWEKMKKKSSLKNFFLITFKLRVIFNYFI